MRARVCVCICMCVYVYVRVCVCTAEPRLHWFSSFTTVPRSDSVSGQVVHLHPTYLFTIPSGAVGVVKAERLRFSMDMSEGQDRSLFPPPAVIIA